MVEKLVRKYIWNKENALVDCVSISYDESLCEDCKYAQTDETCCGLILASKVNAELAVACMKMNGVCVYALAFNVSADLRIVAAAVAAAARQHYQTESVRAA